MHNAGRTVSAPSETRSCSPGDESNMLFDIKTAHLVLGRNMFVKGDGPGVEGNGGRR